MKFTIDRDFFISQLNHVTRAIPSKSAIPVLTGIKLELTAQQLTLTGSDASISIESMINVQNELAQLTVIEPGSIVLSARLFTDIVKKLPTSIIEFDLQENYSVQLTSGKAVFTIQGIDSIEYPRLPEIDTDKQLTIQGLLFKKMVNQTIFSASNQETRPILTGLNLTFNQNSLTAVATDSHRLSKRNLTLANIQSQLNGESITIPKKSVIELTRILEDDQVMTLYVMPQQIVFMVENLIIYSRLLEGVYPDISRLIPTAHNTQLTIKTQEFAQAIDRAALLVHVAKSNIVQLQIEQDEVKLLVQGISVGKSVEEINYESVEGQNLTIAFNPDYMRDAVRAFGDTTIKLHFISAERPLLLTVDQSDTDNELIQLLTPIRTHG